MDRSNPTDITDSLLTRREAAERLKICLRSLDYQVNAGRIRIVKIGTATRIRPAALESFINAHEGLIDELRHAPRLPAATPPVLTPPCR